MTYPDEVNMQTYFRIAHRQPPQLVEAGSIEEQRDAVGYTNPNLHRRIDPQEPSAPAVSPNTYKLSIQNNDSYRLTQVATHDEDSVVSEVP